MTAARASPGLRGFASSMKVRESLFARFAASASFASSMLAATYFFAAVARFASAMISAGYFAAAFAASLHRRPPRVRLRGLPRLRFIDDRRE
jgi:hypothetical protein